MQFVNKSLGGEQIRLQGSPSNHMNEKADLLHKRKFISKLHKPLGECSLKECSDITSYANP